MHTPLIPPRGGASTVASYVGPAGSIVVNTDAKTIHVHDGVTAGGFALSKVGHQHTLNEITAALGFTPAALNVSGQVSVAQLGTGTANATKVLFGDGTWKDAPTGGGGGSSNSLSGTGTVSPSTSVSGVYAGVTAGVGEMYLVNAGAGSNEKAIQFAQRADGVFQINLYNDALNSNPTFFSLDRTGAVPNIATFNVNSMVVNGVLSANSFAGVGTALTALNASNLASGTVPVARLGSGTASASTYLRGDGTWDAISAGGSVEAGSILPAAGTSSVTLTTGNQIGANTSADVTIGSGSSANGLTGAVTITSGGTGSLGSGNVTLKSGQTGSGYGSGEVIIGTGATSGNSGTPAVSGAITIATGGWTGTGTNQSSGSITLQTGTKAGSGVGGDINLTTGTGGEIVMTSSVITTTGNLGVGGFGGNGATPGRIFAASGGIQVDQTSLVPSNSLGGSFRIGYLNSAISGTSDGFLTWMGAAATLNVSGANGSVLLASRSDSGTAGVSVATNNTARLFIAGNGAWGLSGANYGTAGQVLTSSGSGSAPTWTSPAVDTLNATGPRGFNIATAAVTAGTSNDGTYQIPCIGLTAPNAPLNEKVWQFSASSGGGFELGGYNDALQGGSYSAYITIGRNAVAANTMQFNAAAITLNGAVTGTSFAGSGAGLTALNASNFSTGVMATARLGSGTADASTYLRGDGTWAAVSAGASTSLSATATSPAPSGTSGTTGVYASSVGGQPTFWFTNSTAAANTKTSVIDQTSGGLLRFNFTNDLWNTATAWLSAQRVSGSNVASAVKLDANSVNLAGLSTGLQLNGSAGTAGQVLTSQGASAAPIWTSASVTALNGTGTFTPSTTTTGVFAGAAGAESRIVFSASGATAGNKLSILAGHSGGFQASFVNDTYDSQTVWLQVARSGNTATNITLTGTAITLNAAVTGTSFAGTHTGVGTGLTALNASNLASGTVATARLGTGTADNSTYLRGDGTWAAAVATSSTSLNGTAAPSARSSSTSGVFAGTIGYPLITMTASGAGANAKSAQIYLDSTTGAFGMSFLPDGLASQNLFFTASRNGATAATITLTSTAMNLAVGTGGLQLNGSAGTAGQVLTSNGPSAAPTWAAPAPAVLAATGNYATVLTSGVYAGLRTNAPALQLVNTSCATDAEVTSLVHDNDGVVRLRLWANNFASNNYAFEVVRNGAAVPSMFKLYGTAINLAVGTGGLQLNGVAGTAGQVLMSGGAGVAPTWSSTYAGQMTFSAGITCSSVTAMEVAGASGALQLGYLNAAVTSVQDAFVAWGGTSSTLVSGVTGASSNGTLVLSSRNTSNAGVTIATNNTVRLVTQFNGTVRPGADATQDFGATTFRWNNGYFGALFTTAGTVSVSDERLKTDIFDLEDAEVRVAQQLKQLLKKYRLKSEVAAQGAKAKWHVGIIAQAVVKAFADEGLDAHDYAMLSLTDVDGVDQYGVNYDELLAFIIAAL